MLTTYSTPELRVDCADDVKFGLVHRVLEHYRATRSVINVDGARIQFDHRRGLVRASNTQPVLKARFEAESEQRLQKVAEKKWSRRWHVCARYAPTGS